MEEENRREEDTKTIIVEREEKMLSHSKHRLHSPALRIGKFLSSSVTSLTQASPIPSTPLLSETIAYNLTTWPASIHFKGWRNPQSKWEQWVNQLAPLHCSIWNQSGICESILSSIYKFEKDKNLILGLVEFWCPETNSFIFPWGEVTITLEDLLILGGFSVLGLPVTSPLDGDILNKISDDIHEEHKACYRSKARKPSDYQWLNQFMGSNSELEHVAFISLWLSRFVFPEHPADVVRKQVFSVAIHLAQGTRIALAPAILSGLYRELTLLKNRVTSQKKLGTISVWGPFQLVQLWVWEHFPSLRPDSINSLIPGEPRVARWQKLKSKAELSIVRSTLCSMENFQWRPYVDTVNNWRIPLFYREREELLDVQADDDELMSFFCCLRACEIIGLNGSVERYLPYRVARQLGFDQDLPGTFSEPSDGSLESAWKTYEKSTTNAKSFVRSRFLESSVTSRYSEWWKSSMSVREAKVKKILEQERMWKNLKSSNQYSSKNVKKSQVLPHSSKNVKKKLSCSNTKSVAENSVSTQNPVISTHNKSPAAETEEVENEDDQDEDELPISKILKLHKDHKCFLSPNSQAQSISMSSVLNKMGHRKRKLSDRIDKKLDEKVVEKEEKIGSSVKNPLNAEEYEEGTIEKPIYIHDYGGKIRSSLRETAEAVVILD